MRTTIFLIALAALPATARAEPSTLEKAYLKELAFLKAEKAELEKRLSSIDAETTRRAELAEAELHRLEARLLGLRRKADDAEQQLRQSADVAAADKTEVALETLGRARELLEPAGHLLPGLPADRAPNKAELEAAVGAAFTGASSVVSAGGKVTRERGSFFLPSGEQVEGEVLRVGRVAAYGVSERGAGALLPAGLGRLKLYPEPAEETARALARGRSTAALPIFLFESTETEIKLKKVLGLAEQARAGGPIAWLIVAVGILAGLMILYRAAALFLLGRHGRALTAEVVRLVRGGEVKAAEALLARRRGPVARVLATTLRHLAKDRASLDDIVHEAVLHEVPAIERFGAGINVLAAVAPLLGLLGTVTGMIATFDILTEVGNSDPKMLSAGISEALITTKFGLIVAIPALLAGSLLGGKADALLAGLQHAALRVVNAADGVVLEGDSGSGSKTPPARAESEPRGLALAPATR